MRRPFWHAAALSTVALVTVAPNATAGMAADPGALSAYMTQVKPHAVNAKLYADQAIGAIPRLNYAKLRQAGMRLQATADKLQKLKAPLLLAEPHGSFVRGIRIQGRALTRFVSDIQAGVGRVRAGDKVVAAFSTAQKLLDHWQEEAEAQLRASGLPVPLWLKNVGR